jgi:hypothetical protein
VWRRGTKQRKKTVAYFQAAVFFCAVKCLWNGGRRLFLPTTDWNSRAEQRKRPERDRLIARDVFAMMFWKLFLLLITQEHFSN